VRDGPKGLLNISAAVKPSSPNLVVCFRRPLARRTAVVSMSGCTGAGDPGPVGPGGGQVAVGLDLGSASTSVGHGAEKIVFFSLSAALQVGKRPSRSPPRSRNAKTLVLDEAIVA
jgi:hypothetical protein